MAPAPANVLTGRLFLIPDLVSGVWVSIFVCIRAYVQHELKWLEVGINRTGFFSTHFPSGFWALIVQPGAALALCRIITGGVT